MATTRLSKKGAARSRAQKYYQAHKSEILVRVKQWAAENPEKRQATLKRFAVRHRESERERSRRRHKANPRAALERLKRWQRKARINNPQFVVKCRLKTRLSHAFKGIGKKTGSTIDLIGCSFMELKQHIERQFIGGMSWERIKEIEIDHIIPCARFDLTDPEQQRRCFNYSNLQPLWKLDNRRKGAR